jgi:hypothetical protein
MSGKRIEANCEVFPSNSRRKQMDFVLIFARALFTTLFGLYGSPEELAEAHVQLGPEAP